MLNRIFFAITNAIKNKSILQQAANSNTISDLKCITPKLIQSLSIKALVLDFDGVLAPHGDAKPTKYSINILHNLQQTLPELAIFILTNKPNYKREEFFTQTFPKVKFIRAVKKKPYPHGLQKILIENNFAAEELAIVDDRILTGGLAAMLANVKWIYFFPALHNFKSRPIKEVMFAFLRSFERLWVL